MERRDSRARRTATGGHPQPATAVRSVPGAPVAALVVVGVTAAIYADTLRNGFVWDDSVVLGKQLAAFRTARDLLLPPANIPQFSPFYYRPVVVLTYLIDHAAGGGTPLPFHLTSMLLHTIAAGLVFLLFLHLLGPRWLVAAAAGALVFAVHPIHTEVAAWMAGRSDALATVGVLAALLAWGRWLETATRTWLGLGTAALLLGLLSKETALAGVPLAAALPWVWPRSEQQRPPRATRDDRRTWLWVAIAAAVALYAALRWLALGFTAGASHPSTAGATAVLGTLGFYLLAFLWPQTVGSVRTAVPAGALDVGFGLGGLVLWAIAFIWALRRRADLAAWALAWIALGLGPALLLVLRSIAETPVADRYLYLPSAGAALLIAWALTRLPARWERAGVTVLGLVLVGWAVQTIRHVPAWRDDFAFWRNAVDAVPDEGFAQLKLASALHQRGDEAAAEATFRKALAVRLSPPQRVVVLNNLGWVLLRQGRRDEAEPLLRRAVAAAPLFTGPYRGLAECLWPRGEDAAVRTEVRALLERAVGLDPTDAPSAFLLAKVYFAEGDRARGVYWLEQTIRANPTSSSAAGAREMLATLQAR